MTEIQEAISMGLVGGFLLGVFFMAGLFVWMEVKAVAKMERDTWG